MSLIIREVSIPFEPGTQDSADFDAATDIVNRVDAAAIGSDDFSWRTDEHLAEYTDPWQPRRLFLGLWEGQPVAVSTFHGPLEGGSTAAWLLVNVLPSHRQRGIGTAMLSHLDAVASAASRVILQGTALHEPVESGERIASPTGFGAVFTGDPGARFLVHSGYRLVQVMRISRLELPWAAVAVDGGTVQHGYTLERWTGPTPAESRDDLAALHRGMSTDAPIGDFDVSAETWDAARVLDSDTRLASGDRTLLTIAARHTDSGRIVGFTQLSVPPDATRPVFQDDTIVGDAHRGHRLGMALKVAGLEWLSEIAPSHRSLYTWNAEENRHMLDINEAVGFTAVGYEGGWRRDVGAPETAPPHLHGR